MIAELFKDELCMFQADDVKYPERNIERFE